MTTSSQAHRLGASAPGIDLDWTRGYRRWPVYGMSKLANLCASPTSWTGAPSGGCRLASIAAHPGYASTHLQAVGPEQSGSRSMAAAMRAAATGSSHNLREMGALPQLFAAVDPGAIAGGYYGPDGPGEQRGHPRLVGSSAASLRTEEWVRLWQRSEAMTGLRLDLA